MSGIRDTLVLNNTPEINDVNLDDSNDVVGQSVTYSVASGLPKDFVMVHGLAPGDVKMAIGDTGNIGIKLGTGGNSFVVENTAAIVFGLTIQTTITTGGGGDDVRVHATGPGTVIVNLADGDSVTIGSAANMLNGITSAVTVHGSGSGPNVAGTINLVDVGNSGDASYTATNTSFRSGTQTIVNFDGIGNLELWEATGSGTTLTDTHDPTIYTLDIRTDPPPS